MLVHAKLGTFCSAGGERSQHAARQHTVRACSERSVQQMAPTAQARADAEILRLQTVGKQSLVGSSSSLFSFEPIKLSTLLGGGEIAV